MDQIDVDKIDTSDTRFSVSYPLEDAQLLSAVSRFGFLTPVALLDRDHPVLVMGFKRIEAARKLGIARIPCIFLNVDEKTALLTAINDNMGRPLNTIEKAHCVERLRNLSVPADDIEVIMKMMGLPARDKTVESAVAVASLDDRFKSFAVRHAIPFSTLEQLLWLDTADRDRVMGLTDGLRPTASFLRETLQLVMLLKVKQGEVDFNYLAGATDMTSLRQRLKSLTHPRLSALQDELAEVLRECALPPHVRLNVDPAFEREWIEISIKANDDADIDDALKKIDQIRSQGRFGRIFGLTRGNRSRD